VQLATRYYEGTFPWLFWCLQGSCGVSRALLPHLQVTLALPLAIQGLLPRAHLRSQVLLVLRGIPQRALVVVFLALLLAAGQSNGSNGSRQ
jgi:hypothetical protein